jgi:hypothetical protein
MEKFTFAGLLLRFVLALALVLITFNPSGHSYLHSLASGFPEITPFKVVAGIALLIAWIVFVRATLQSIGVVGVVLMALFFAALIWLLVSWGWIDVNKARSAGSCSSFCRWFHGRISAHIRRRLAGQATVDEVEEP